MSLSSVIREVNAFRRGPKIDPRHVTMRDAIQLFEHIDFQLSPEWLHQDGVRPYYRAMKREQQLKSAAQALVTRGYRAPKLSNMAVSEKFPKTVS